MIADCPIYVLNLERSKDRREDMIDSFPLEDLTFIDAVDGNQWASGLHDENGKPLFNPEKLQNLFDTNILSKEFFEYHAWVPGEVGCALSHAKAWQLILDGKEDFAIVLEDDVKPVLYDSNKILHTQIILPENADILFLTGEDSLGSIMELTKIGEVFDGSCNFGYVITKEGARKSLENFLPLAKPCDHGWWYNFEKIRWPDLPPFGLKKTKSIKAYGLKRALIKKHKNADRTTFSESGIKTWHK